MRPLPFAQHVAVTRPLLDRLGRGEAHHANLFVGPEGVGKFLWARWAAQVALCETGTAAADGTCTCRSCAQQDAHPDLLLHGPAPETFKVDAIRELVQKCSLKPLIGSRRAVLIRDADSMTPQAQNALLKTLEEPVGQTIFFLTSHREQRLLRTVRSRCQVVRFAPLGEATLSELFAEPLGKLAPEGRAALLAASAGSAAQCERLIAGSIIGAGEDQLPPLGKLLKAPARDRLKAAEGLAADHATTVLAAIRFGHQLTQWTRDGNEAQRHKAHGLFVGLSELVRLSEGNGNRRMLWERWLLSVTSSG